MPFWRRKSQDDGSSISSNAGSIPQPEAELQQQQPQQELELQLEQPIPPPDFEGSSSSSSSSSGSTDASASAAEQQQEQQPDDSSGSPADDNPMLQTSLTRRFKGRFHPMQMPTYDLIQQEELMNNCGVKSVIAGVMGGVLGVAFGVFTASMDNQSVDTTQPTRVVLRESWRVVKEKSRGYAKGFAGMGFLYSGTECMIEKYRARHDNWNATLAGCATGGLMAAPGGAKAMCFGCASFAAFSTAIEYFTGGH